MSTDTPVRIVSAGVTFRDAISLREAAARGARAPAVARALGPDVECVVLATCDRHEVFAAARRPGLAEEVAGVVARLGGIPAAQLTVRRGREAARHLMRVTMGLDAAIVGEHEIQGQVGHAWRQARHAGACGPVMHRWFQQALHTAGRARAHTGLGRGRTSLASLVVADLHAQLGGPPRTAVVVGTDPVARGVVRRLARIAPDGTFIAGPRGAAGRLAMEVGARPLPEGCESRVVGGADVLVACVTPVGALAEAVAARAPGLLVMDLAMPRAFPDGARRGRVRTLAHLHEAAAAGAVVRQRDAAAAERLASAGAAALMDWLAGRQAVPAVRALLGHADALAERELARALRGVDDPEVRARLARLTRGLTRALMHDPVGALRRSPHPEADLAVLMRMFGVRPPPDAPGNVGDG